MDENLKAKILELAALLKASPDGGQKLIPYKVFVHEFCSAEKNWQGAHFGFTKDKAALDQAVEELEDLEYQVKHL